MPRVWGKVRGVEGEGSEQLLSVSRTRGAVQVISRFHVIFTTTLTSIFTDEEKEGGMRSSTLRTQLGRSTSPPEAKG